MPSFFNMGCLKAAVRDRQGSTPEAGAEDFNA
jgi:hypothetical protein